MLWKVFEISIIKVDINLGSDIEVDTKFKLEYGSYLDFAVYNTGLFYIKTTQIVYYSVVFRVNAFCLLSFFILAKY